MIWTEAGKFPEFHCSHTTHGHDKFGLKELAQWIEQQRPGLLKQCSAVPPTYTAGQSKRPSSAPPTAVSSEDEHYDAEPEPEPEIELSPYPTLGRASLSRCGGTPGGESCASYRVLTKPQF